jgi:3-hydroxybutyryl-CoA dehydrogenase
MLNPDNKIAERIVGIVGAGQMGSGIAECVAVAGMRVTVHEPDAAPLERSRERIAASLEKAVARGKLSRDAAADALGRITHTTDMSDLRDCDLAIEAVTEDEAIKTQVLRKLDDLLAPDAIFASNTSSIPIATLAAATARPQQVVGLHFFSPVPVMAIVEIIPALTTSPDVVLEIDAFARQIGKHAICSKDRAGFVVNLLLIPYLASAVRLYDGGLATREDIDDGMRIGCGHPMGPLALCDFIGLDVIEGICVSLHDEYGRDDYAPPPLLRRMVSAGRLGRKSGRGFYDYGAVRADGLARR